MVDLEQRVSELESWTDGKGLIVQGAAGTFCSGSDLNAVRAISNPQVEQQRNPFQGISSLLLYTYPLCSLAGWDEDVHVHAERPHKAAQVRFLIFHCYSGKWRLIKQQQPV